MVLRSVVAQLAKTNEKFIYGVVREGGRTVGSGCVATIIEYSLI